MLKTSLWQLGSAFCFLALSLSGCSGGGGEGGEDVVATPAPVSSLQYVPSACDFGYVTLNNSPAPKLVTLSNHGNSPINVSNIEPAGAGFALDLNSGVDSCGSITPTLAAGGSCSVAVSFSPVAATTYNGSLTVSSNDPDLSTIVILLSGNGVVVDIADPKIRINQVEPDACPSSELTVYVSVTDQTGYPVSGLLSTDFSLAQTIISPASSPIKALDYVDNVLSPISVALVMDYSASVTNDPDVVAEMEAGVINFINELSAIDEAEIIKFDSGIEVVQPFITGTGTNKVSLIAKVEEDWDQGIYTKIYDAAYQAVTDTAARGSDRRAVIVLSDGFDKGNDGSQLSTHTLQQVIDHADASGVPIFTIGIGAELKSAILEQLSNDTGGQYFNAPGPDDLRTIYQQQAEILFVDQYILTYDSIFSAADSALLTAGVDLGGGPKFDSRTIIPCP